MKLFLRKVHGRKISSMRLSPLTTADASFSPFLLPSLSPWRRNQREERGASTAEEREGTREDRSSAASSPAGTRHASSPTGADGKGLLRGAGAELLCSARHRWRSGSFSSTTPVASLLRSGMTERVVVPASLVAVGDRDGGEGRRPCLS
jgi:hypothetical protein